MFTARIRFYKDVEKDNWEKGCYGGIERVSYTNINIDFEDKEDLLLQLAKWTASRFGVEELNFLKYVENECENNRFDYARPEDEDGYYKKITEDDPDGYYAMYFYEIEEVFKPVHYVF